MTAATTMMIGIIATFSVFLASTPSSSMAHAASYAVTDTDQTFCANSAGSTISCSNTGQDGDLSLLPQSFNNHGDGTATDINTGLMWTTTVQGSFTPSGAATAAASYSGGGYNDWRLPTMKELYTLAMFDGMTGQSEAENIPYLDPIFTVVYGTNRFIDGQLWSSNKYVDRVMRGTEDCFFGLNPLDGRIKCYGERSDKYALFVRDTTGGNTKVGINSFTRNGGIVADANTGLEWMQADHGTEEWQGALDYCNSLTLESKSDWRLPSAAELHSIVDYSRSPGTTSSAAIDPIFSSTQITNEAGQSDYPWYWTSTTHRERPNIAAAAVYIAFGRATGNMTFDNGNTYEVLDVHGAGAQRSDPKQGPNTEPYGFGPQGDYWRISNYVRCVRGTTSAYGSNTPAPTPSPTPSPAGVTPTPTSGTGWRIRSTAAGVSRGQGQYWDVNEVEFYTSSDCTTGKVDVSSGTITVSGTASGSQYVASNAFDSNDSSFWGGRKSGSTFWIGKEGLSDVTVNCVTVNQKNAETIFVDVLSSGSWVEVGEFTGLSDGTTDLIVNDSATSAPTPAPVQGGTPTSGTGWRIKATASGVSRGQGQYWDVRELEFYTSSDCTTGQVDVSSGTITVSGTASGSQYVASNAFDGNDSSFWGGRKSGSTFWIGMQGLSDVTVNCVTVNQKNADTIFVEVLSSGSWVEVGEFTGLSDGTTDLIVNDSSTPTPTPTSGTGWRIEATAAGVSRGQGQYWDVRELEFYTSSDCSTGKVDSSTGTITVSGTASGSQYVASNAFDGNDSSFWGGRKSGSTFWIGLTGLSEVTIKCVTVNQKNADTIFVKVLSSGSWVEVGEFTGLSDGTTDLIVDDSGGTPTAPTSGTGWRIKSTAAGVSRGQGQYWDVRELGFFTSADCINGKVDSSTGSITVSGTASGSQYVASNAFDGNSGSFWGGRKSGSTFWIGLEGLSEVAVKCVVVNQKNADTIAVEVLSSGSWVEVGEFSSLTDGTTDLIVDDSGTPTPTPTSGTGWRIETTPSGVSRGQGQYWDVLELEFYTSADCINGKVNSSTGSITVSGTASGSQYVASNAFDGNDSTFWGGRKAMRAFWIGLEGLSEVSVKCIKVNQKNADTISIKVKVSGSWIFVGTVTGVTDGITEIDLS